MSIVSICGFFDYDKHQAAWTEGEISLEHYDAFCISYLTVRADGLPTYKDIFFFSLAEAMLWCDLHLYAYDDREDHISLVAADPFFFTKQTYATVGTPP